MKHPRGPATVHVLLPAGNTNIRIDIDAKPVRFLGTTKTDLAAFNQDARRRIGHELFLVQVGREPSDFKAVPTVGSGAFEIRVRDKAGAFRVIYVAKFGSSIYVLHVSQKKTRKTSLSDIEIANHRYRSIREDQ